MVVKKIALLTSGGDAPGMNAAIRAVVRSSLSSGLTPVGIENGFLGLLNNSFTVLNARSVSNIIQRGGTILKTSRCKDFRAKKGLLKAKEHLEQHDIDALCIIGGDGSLKGALELSELWKGKVIGIPGTIDNDLSGCDETIGFDTAVNTALSAIDKIRDTADAHGRFFLIQVMGRKSGFIALKAAIAGGCEDALIPEETSRVEELLQTLEYHHRLGKKSSIIIVAEGCPYGNARSIATFLQGKSHGDYRVVDLGHLLRGGSPTARDRILASQLGHFAVESLQDYHEPLLVGVVNNQLKKTAIKNVLKTSKKIDHEDYRLLHRLV